MASSKASSKSIQAVPNRSAEQDRTVISREMLVKMYEEIEEQRKQEEQKKTKNPFEVDDEYKPKKMTAPSVYKPDGDIRLCN